MQQILSFLIAFVVIAAAIWLVDTYIPMTAWLRSLFHVGLPVVAVIVLLIWARNQLKKSG
jgi:hypothetical protein